MLYSFLLNLNLHILCFKTRYYLWPLMAFSVFQLSALRQSATKLTGLKQKFILTTCHVFVGQKTRQRGWLLRSVSALSWKDTSGRGMERPPALSLWPAWISSQSDSLRGLCGFFQSKCPGGPARAVKCLLIPPQKSQSISSTIFDYSSTSL